MQPSLGSSHHLKEDHDSRLRMSLHRGWLILEKLILLRMGKSPKLGSRTTLLLLHVSTTNTAFSVPEYFLVALFNFW
jgi:hypothetical protein